MRPILDMIDFTVRHLAAAAGDLEDFDGFSVSPTDSNDNEIQHLIPNFSYSQMDCYHDFCNNPREGSSEGGKSVWKPKGSFPVAPEASGKVALIGHSAGGWISRAYLSERKYGGKYYGGKNFVHSLVTLGSPHGNAPGPAFKGVEWVNSEVMDASSGVRALAVSGRGYRGDSSGMLTKSSYAFCCPKGSDGSQYDGDGVTPIASALAMKEYVPHADTLVLDDVGHYPWSDSFGGNIVAPDLTKYHREGRPWYGDEAVMEKWAEWL